MDFISFMFDMMATLDIDDLPEQKDVNIEALLSERIDMYFYSPPQLNKKEKDILFAHFLQENGDETLNKCSLQNAVQLYTDALRKAPPESYIVSECYHSRAKTLQRMKKYDDALLDLERALQLRMNDEKRDEILGMQKRLIELKSRDSGKNRKSVHKKSTETNVTVSYEENKEVLGASSAIRLTNDEEFGRFFAATKPIKPKDVLLVQEPYIVIVHEIKELQFCHHCAKQTMALIPCDSCVNAVYCSVECRSKAYKKYHRIECKISTEDYDSMVFLRFFLVVTEQGKRIAEMLAYIKNNQKVADRRTIGFTNNQFNGKSAEAVLSLVNHMEKYKVHAMPWIMKSGLLTCLLKTHTNILNGHNIYEVANLMCYLAFTFRMNSVLIRDKNLTDICAEAIYPVFNLLNHSCVTNTIWYTTPDNKRVLLACRDIKPGEQIFNNYLSQNIIVLNSKRRRTHLLQGKHFLCSCEACAKDYDFKREIKRLKVPMQVKRQLKKNPTNIDSMWQVLNSIYQVRKSPCVEIEILKFGLMEAYTNNVHGMLLPLYKGLGIL